MNWQKIGLATLVGGIAFFLLGYLIWGMGLDPMIQEHTINYSGLVKEVPEMGLLAVSMFLTSFLYAYIFEKWANISTFQTGAKAGALLATILGLSYDLMSMSMMNLFDYTVVGLDVVGNLIWGALGGGIIGYILGYKKS